MGHTCLRTVGIFDQQGAFVEDQTRKITQNIDKTRKRKRTIYIQRINNCKKNETNKKYKK